MGIFDSLMSKVQVSEVLKQSVYQALQSKDQTEVKALTQDFDAETREALCRLTELNGDASILTVAAKDLPKTHEIAFRLRKVMNG